MGNGVESNLEATVVEFIDKLVVCVLMADVEGGSDWAVVYVCAAVKNFAVGLNVDDVDSVIEGDHYELKCSFLIFYFLS